MKRRVLLLVSIALAVHVAVAQAAPLAFGFCAGTSTPTGDLASGVGDGFHLGLSAATPVDAHNLTELDLEYHQFGAKSSVLGSFGSPLRMRQQLDLTEAMLIVRVLVAPKSARVVPYVKAGFGLEHARTDLTAMGPGWPTHAIATNNWVGVAGGAGVSLPLLGRTRVCLEGLYHQIRISNASSNLFTVSLGPWSLPGR